MRTRYQEAFRSQWFSYVPLQISETAPRFISQLSQQRLRGHERYTVFNVVVEEMKGEKYMCNYKHLPQREPNRGP